jgi:hypothetical protein
MAVLPLSEVLNCSASTGTAFSGRGVAIKAGTGLNFWLDGSLGGHYGEVAERTASLTNRRKKFAHMEAEAP